jgi:hypothetical protein
MTDMHLETYKRRAACVSDMRAQLHKVTVIPQICDLIAAAIANTSG